MKLGKPGNKPTDAGSALPLFIFGSVLLILLALCLASASQLLQQQRRLNCMSDALALDLAASGFAIGEQSNQSTLRNLANTDARVLYPPETKLGTAWVSDVGSPAANEASVRVCQQVALVWSAVAPSTVCASSSAGYR